VRRAYQLSRPQGYQRRNSYGGVSAPPRLLTMGIPPWENPAMREASDRRRVRNQETDVERLGRETHRTVATNPGPPRGRGVHHPEMFLHAVRTSRRFGNQMSGRRFGSLDLDKTFRAYRLVATPRVVDVRGVILSPPRTCIPRSHSRTGQQEWKHGGFRTGQRGGESRTT